MWEGLLAKIHQSGKEEKILQIDICKSSAESCVIKTYPAPLLCLNRTLKVPKREIFDRSDFPDFYTIKSLRVGVFGVKIKKISKVFRGSEVQSSLRVCSVYF